MDDIRVKISFLGHRKRKRLRRLLGPGATDYLIDLWIVISMNNPDGDISDWTALDIADAADWPEDKDPNILVDALVDSGFFDRMGDSVRPHDWPEHQPFIVERQARIEKATINGLISRHGKQKGLALAKERGIDWGAYGYTDEKSDQPTKGSTDSSTTSSTDGPTSGSTDSPAISSTPTHPPIALTGQQAAGPKKVSEHYTSHLADKEKEVRRKIAEFLKLPPKNGYKFNPHQAVTWATKQRFHPKAIYKALCRMVEKWTTIKGAPWPYWQSTVAVLSKNLHEADGMESGHMFKRQEADFAKANFQRIWDQAIHDNTNDGELEK